MPRRPTDRSRQVKLVRLVPSGSRLPLWYGGFNVAPGLVLLLAVASTSVEAASAATGMTSAQAASKASSDAEAASEVEKFVQTNIDNAFLLLNNQELDVTERQRQFREFLFSLVDTKRIALFTLGPYARTVSDGDLGTFLTAYNNFVAALFQGYFDWYKGEALRVASSTARSSDDVVVFADIVGPNGIRRFRTAFRVRRDSAGKNVVTDFQFEGAWFALNQRADFTSYLQQHNGNFTMLTSELDKRTERFKKDWAPPTKQ